MYGIGTVSYTHLELALFPALRYPELDTVSARFLFDTANEEIDRCPCPCPKRKNYTVAPTESDAKP